MRPYMVSRQGEITREKKNRILIIYPRGRACAYYTSYLTPSRAISFMAHDAGGGVIKPSIAIDRRRKSKFRQTPITRRWRTKRNMDLSWKSILRGKIRVPSRCRPNAGRPSLVYALPDGAVFVRSFRQHRC